jgi:nitrite reductase (NO-forming)
MSKNQRVEMKLPLKSIALSGVVALAACGQGGDDYDVKKMDLKPVPAKVSTERHKGAFAEGAALSMGSG